MITAAICLVACAVFFGLGFWWGCEFRSDTRAMGGQRE